MPIDLNNITSSLNQSQAVETNPASSQATTTAAEGSAPQPSDTVKITAQAQQLQQIQQQLKTTSEVDQAKVAELRQAYTEGRLAVDSQQLADKIMAFEQQLGHNED